MAQRFHYLYLTAKSIRLRLCPRWSSPASTISSYRTRNHWFWCPDCTDARRTPRIFHLQIPLRLSWYRDRLPSRQSRSTLWQLHRTAWRSCSSLLRSFVFAPHLCHETLRVLLNCLFLPPHAFLLWYFAQRCRRIAQLSKWAGATCCQAILWSSRIMSWLAPLNAWSYW